MDDQIREVVSVVPRGRVVSYGAVGTCLRNPVSGLLVGRAMRRLSELPWWRVVLASGGLATWRLDPALGAEQQRLLLAEGVSFHGDLVARDHFLTLDELLALCPDQPNRPEM